MLPWVAASFCGVCICSFDRVVYVSIAGWGCELCLVGVVFVVTWCAGVAFLRDLV